jgi:hypothetical protein
MAADMAYAGDKAMQELHDTRQTLQHVGLDTFYSRQ